MIGECAFNKGDVVVTIGTVTIINANIGSKPYSASDDIYAIPIINFLNSEIFALSTAASSAGAEIDWAKSIGNQVIHSIHVFSDICNRFFCRIRVGKRYQKTQLVRS